MTNRHLIVCLLYTSLAVDTFQDYKTKFENGDITADDLTKAVQEKKAQVADFAKESFELIKEKTAQEMCIRDSFYPGIILEGLVTSSRRQSVNT